MPLAKRKTTKQLKPNQVQYKWVLLENCVQGL